MTGSGMDGGVTVAITRADAHPGIDIVDPIERRRCTLLTDEPVAPSDGDATAFQLPVDTAVDIKTTGIHAPFAGHAYVRDEHHEAIAEVVNDFNQPFPSGYYNIELTGLIKVYLEFTGPFTAKQAGSSVAIEFDDPTRVQIGSRSLHTRPATTITTTEEPADILSAISAFGSALKTLDPERSFPTLRGHPPALELGNTLTIPSGLEPPCTNVRIEVPPRFEYVYPIAPLAYYLGIPAEPGHIPRLVGDGIDYSLDHPTGFSRGVHEVLQRVFFLDCITRTEGLYPVDLYERKQVENRIHLDYQLLYQAEQADRLQEYLEIPFNVIEDIIPDWRLAAHVEPDASSATMLPYLANDLALITMANPEPIPHATLSPASAGFTRGAGAETRGGSSTQNDTFVRPTGGPQAMETAWVSQGTPVEATKAIPAAYQNRLGRTPQDKNISIAVVCNSSDMDQERAVVNEVYGNHESMPFAVDVRENLTTGGLRELLAEDFNFFHYIGHIDDDGFRCADGRLDVTRIADVAPEAFFLNACQSYDQGLSLIESGAIGGIVTLNDVVNHGAVRIGQSVARLLNGGFPLRAALDIAATRSIIGSQYVVVGDGTLSIVQPPSGTPKVSILRETKDGFTLQIDGYGSPPGMGCMYCPYVAANSQQFLSEGKTKEIHISREELRDFFQLENAPVMIDEQLNWSYDLDDSLF